MKNIHEPKILMNIGPIFMRKVFRRVPAKSGRGLSLKNWNQSALDSASRESSAQDEGLFPHIRWLEVAGVCLCMKPRSSCGDSSRFATGERTPSLRNLRDLSTVHLVSSVEMLARNARYPRGV